jgi:hypothetical protein
MLHLGAVGAQGNCHHGASPSALRFSGGRAPLVARALLARSLAAPAHSSSLAEYSGRSSACRSTGRSGRSSPASTRASSGRSSPSTSTVSIYAYASCRRSGQFAGFYANCRRSGRAVAVTVRRLLQYASCRGSGRSSPASTRAAGGAVAVRLLQYASCRRNGRSSPSTDASWERGGAAIKTQKQQQTAALLPPCPLCLSIPCPPAAPQGKAPAPARACALCNYAKALLYVVRTR